MTKTSLILDERIEHGILLVRGHKVLLDEELAALYGVEVRALNQAVSRNLERFPGDFSFVLLKQEVEILRSQDVILKKPHGQHRKYPPRAFTEQGAIMALVDEVNQKLDAQYLPDGYNVGLNAGEAA